MITDEIQQQIDSITKQLIEKYKPETIILFGSAATGRMTRDSDLDFLIIKDDKKDKYERMVEVSGLIKKNIAADFLVYTPQEFSKRLSLGDPFIKSIVAEGKVLYGNQDLKKVEFSMPSQQIVEEWIKKADEDLAFAKVTLEQRLEFFDQICFYFHQAGEKYLKAYIVANELDFRKIHNLMELLQICGQRDDDFNKYYEQARLLNPLYIETRYPGDVITEYPIIIDRFRAEQALQATEEIALFVKSKLQ